MQVELLCRYPVKGLNAEVLERVDLTLGAGIAHDRAFAVLKPGAEFDELMPEHRRKTNFLALMTHESLAALSCSYDAATGRMDIRAGGRHLISEDVRSPDCRRRIGQVLAAHAGFDGAAAARARLLHAPGHMFSDVAKQCLSLINLESVEALASRLGRSLDPLRFRGNIMFRGLPAWQELDWRGGQALEIGKARLRVLEPIKRCPAIDVDPTTAQRDTRLPRALVEEFGHPFMGVYAEVTRGGTAHRGDVIAPLY